MDAAGNSEAGTPQDAANRAPDPTTVAGEIAPPAAETEPGDKDADKAKKKKDKKEKKAAAENAEPRGAGDGPGPQATILLLLPAEHPPTAADVWGHLSHAGFQRASYIARFFAPRLERRPTWFSRRGSDFVRSESSPLLGASPKSKSPIFSPNSPFRFLDSFLSRRPAPTPSLPEPPSAPVPQITRIIVPKPTLVLTSEVAAAKGWIGKGKAGSMARGFAHLRPRQTVQPLANALGILVEEKYGVDEWKKVVEELQRSEGTILVCWEREEGERIAGRLVDEEGLAEARAAGLIPVDDAKKKDRKGKGKGKERDLDGNEDEETEKRAQDQMFEFEEDETPAEEASANEREEPGSTGPVDGPQKLPHSETPSEAQQIEPPLKLVSEDAVPAGAPDSVRANPKPEKGKEKDSKKKRKKDKGSSSADEKKSKAPRIPFPPGFVGHDTYFLIRGGRLQSFRMNFFPEPTPVFAPEDLIEVDEWEERERDVDEWEGGLGTGCCWLGGHGCGPEKGCSLM